LAFFDLASPWRVLRAPRSAQVRDSAITVHANERSSRRTGANASSRSGRSLPARLVRHPASRALPIRGPRNGVTWLAGENGVRPSGHLTLWSSGPFPLLGSESGESCSVELSLQPGLPRDSTVILAFSVPTNPLRLTLHQYRSLLILQTGTPSSLQLASTIGTDGVFHQGTQVFVTLTSGPQQTAIYINSSLTRSFPGYHFSADCAGRLVVGASPVIDQSWRGLALYGQSLKADEVRRHYEIWTKQGRPDLSGNERAVALYLFKEYSGNVVHNGVAGGIDLYIPPRYTLVHQILLEPFWREYKPRWSYVKDILINIVGFMPLGFLFYAYWTSVRPVKHAALITTALGLAVSLTIEVSQSYIPSRDSGTTDLITNTLGTFLGVRLYGWSVARTLFTRIYSVKTR
jgi:VanZ family protein